MVLLKINCDTHITVRINNIILMHRVYLTKKDLTFFLEYNHSF